MKTTFKSIIGTVFLTLVFSSVGWSQSTADIVLIIDSSGSMADNDPRDLRKAAANLFITLAAGDVQSDVQIAIIDFDDRAVTLAQLTVADATGKTELETAVNRIDSNNGTNIAAGLQQGFEALSASSDLFVTRKAAVLLTDGEDNDPKPLDAYVASYVENGWNIYTIGLVGGGLGENLLKDIAAATPEGEYYEVDLSKIQEIYNKILAKVTRKSVLSSLRGFLNQDQGVTKGVGIDSTVRQVDFTASWTGSTIKMVLVDPSGTEITPDIATALGVGYQVAPTFVIYTVDSPMKGEWKMKIQGTDIPPEGEPYSLVVTGTSDFITNLLAFESSYAIGDTIRIGTRIQKKIGDASQPVLGATTSAEVVRPDGRIETLNLFDDGAHNDNAAGDGVYAGNYTNVDILGTYLIRVSAQNGFSREIQQQIIVGDIDNVYVDGATLIPAAGATLNRAPRIISAVISGPARRINSESITLKIDGTVVDHTYDIVNQLVSFRPEGLSHGKHTVSLSVNNIIETDWSFIVESGAKEPGAKSRFDTLMALLNEGLNMFVAPLVHEKPYTARDLSEMLGATVILIFDTVKQTYLAYIVTDITDGFAVEGGKGYIVNIHTPKTGTFTETTWTHQHVPTAPGPDTPTDAWAFVVSSDLRGFDTHTRCTLTAKNLRTGTEAKAAISADTESVKAVWVDLNRNNVVQAGDMLELTLHDERGTIVAGPLQRRVSNTDIHNAYMRVLLRVGEVHSRDTLLAQNYPNPFNPETWIPYQLSESADVLIQIYDISGHLVRTLNIGLKSAGTYMTRPQAAYWDGKNEMDERVASGIYFYTLQTPGFSATRRMVILK